MTSGAATEREGQEALQLGALEFLHKPVSLERFANVLTFLELHVLKGRKDRRRLPRATMMFPVRVDAGNIIMARFAALIAASFWPRFL